MREYGKAIAVYSEGLLVCPREERLSKGLAAAKRSKAKHGRGRASKAIQKSEAVRRVSRESILKRNDVKKAGTVSAYVKEAREELSVKLAAIQSQMNLLDELETMDDEEKMELLFSVVDIDGEGITARELATALRKHNRELSFQDSIEHAICLIAAFDTTGDARLDLDQFKACIGVMLKDLDVSLADFAEFLVIRMVLSDDPDVPLSDDCTAAEIGLLSNKNVEKDFSAMLNDCRMLDLFHLFDKNGTGELNFREVAIGLYQLTRNLEESTKTAMLLLLTLDADDSRTLNCEQFARLIVAIVASTGSPFDDIADEMVKLLTAPGGTVSKDAIDSEKPEKAELLVETLSYGRCQRLFDLLDVNHEGGIPTCELMDAMQSFFDATGSASGDTIHDVKAMIGFEKDGDQVLDPTHFCGAMTRCAKELGIDLNELIDYMCVTSVTMGDFETTEGFQRAYGNSIKSVNANYGRTGSGDPDIDFYD